MVTSQSAINFMLNQVKLALCINLCSIHVISCDESQICWLLHQTCDALPELTGEFTSDGPHRMQQHSNNSSSKITEQVI